ncbi:MAG: hypothetical protein R8M45_12140, partial [Ghiorsea sp.]
RDVLFSPQGVFKALQAGADVAETADALDMCIDCGACDVLCPENIEIGNVFADFRQQLGKSHPKPSFEAGNAAFQLILRNQVQHKLQNTDFYIISAPAFHADHAKRVAYYSALQQQTGCSINLDLQRNALPTAIGADRLDEKMQVEWLLQGRVFERMIVEDAADKSRLAALSGKPVLHVSELMGKA